jgi:Trypsin-like serine proteases, typically periplasmic, contain C-terminal PDZ domain
MTRVEQAQVRIYATDEKTIVGSGFLVGRREVLTCAHVVTRALGLPDDTPEPPPGRVSLDFPFRAPGQRLAARVVRWHPQGDIAVLELESDPPAGTEPAPLVEGSDLWGHPFRAFGFPAGHPEGVWASGIIRGANACGWLQIENTQETGYRVQPGFSGAPVWDDTLGGIVGMVAAAERDPSVGAAFIIPAVLLSQAVQLATPPTLHFTYPLPPNPFTDILAIRDPARFIGRERLLERVLRLLQAGSVALIGERKIGKSSILWQLKRRLEQEVPTLFWDFFEPISARQLLRETIARLGGSGDTWEDFRTALRGRRVVLLLDELDLALERGFDLDMLRGCRALCQQESGFRLVTASRALPKNIFPKPERGSTPWDFLQPLEVGPFTEEEAQRLLDHPWAPEAPRFDPATCRELIALSGCHPYRLQRAAHHRYEALADPHYDWRAGYERDMEVLE